MFSKLLFLFASLLGPALFAVPAAAQSSGLSSGRRSEDTGAPPINVQPRTPFEQFADRLKLDGKTQIPQAEQIFSEAAKEAAPLGQQMLQLRQRLVNLALDNKPEEMKPVEEAYAATAAKMTAVEGRAFAKVYAMLKPNQQSRATQAFALIAGMFQPAAPRGAARGGRRGGGQR